MIRKRVITTLSSLGIIACITFTNTYASAIEAIHLRESWKGKKYISKPLVLLIDFNNYTFEDIKKEETPRNFKDWSKKHYEDMIFGNKTYKGPKGEELFTMKQYYEDQSGGSFSLEGTVAGWYRAKNSAEYYGKPYRDNHDSNVEGLIKEAFEKACQDKSINLSEYDVEDPFDKDSDGNLHEPDGIIDYLIVVHAGKGEEVGGGTLGQNAIWSHRDKVSETISYNKTDVHGKKIGIRDYMIVPQDAGIGVLAHEYGHVLGLPDEYNIVDGNVNGPIGYWSIMASGSWAGISSGADPSGFSPWCKQYLQNKIGGNWIRKKEINLDDIDEKGLDVLLDEASKKGKNNEAIRVNLPKKNPNSRDEKDRYYLLEWRNHQGTDKGLAFAEGGSLCYDPGLLIWYVDENYLEKDRHGALTGNKDNDVKTHPGYGFIGVIDADQHIINWRDTVTGEVRENASSDYHIHDAAFGLKKSKKIYVDNIKNKPGLVTLDNENFMHPIFSDYRDYSNKGAEESGRIIPSYGLKIYVTGESKDRSVGKIHILKSENFGETPKKKFFKQNSTSNFIKNISLDKNKVKDNEKVVVSVETNMGDLKDEIVLGYESNIQGKEVEKNINLKLVNGKYMAEINPKDGFFIGKWQPQYIILQDKDENAEIIYNGHNVYIDGKSANKEDLSGGNIDVISSKLNGIKIEKLNKNDTLILGESTKIKIRATNQSYKPQDVTLIIGVYNNKNKLIKCERKTENIKFTESRDIDIDLDLKNRIDENKEYTVKAFIWDNLSSRKPLAAPIKFRTISINSLYKEELEKYNKADNIETIKNLLDKNSKGLDIHLDEYNVLTDDMKLEVAQELLDKKSKLVSKEEFQIILNNAISKSKISQYNRAGSAIIIKNILDNEPNILGLNLGKYKRLDTYGRDMVSRELIFNKEALISKEVIQNIIDNAVERALKIQNVDKKIKEFNDIMYNIWFLDETNIDIAKNALNDVINVLEKLDTETRVRYESNAEYKENKNRIEKATEKINRVREEVSKYINAESFESIKTLLHDEINILELSLTEYKKLGEDNKLIVAKEIYNKKNNLKSKNDIQNIINTSLEKIKTLTVDKELLKYIKAENKLEVKKLLENKSNSLDLMLNVYLKLSEENKEYVCYELYKAKDTLIEKDILQNKINKLVTDILLYDLDEAYEDCFGNIDNEFIESTQQLLIDIQESLNVITNSKDKQELLNTYRSYEIIKNEIKKTSKPQYTVEGFKSLLKNLQDLIDNQELDNEEGLKKAEDMIKNAEDILDLLKSNGEYAKLEKRILTLFEIIKEEVKNS